METKYAIQNNITKKVISKTFDSYQEAKNEINCRYVDDIRNFCFTDDRYKIIEISE